MFGSSFLLEMNMFHTNIMSFEISKYKESTDSNACHYFKLTPKVLNIVCVSAKSFMNWSNFAFRTNKPIFFFLVAVFPLFRLSFLGLLVCFKYFDSVVVGHKLKAKHQVCQHPFVDGKRLFHRVNVYLYSFNDFVWMVFLYLQKNESRYFSLSMCLQGTYIYH